MPFILRLLVAITGGCVCNDNANRLTEWLTDDEVKRMELLDFNVRQTGTKAYFQRVGRRMPSQARA